MDINTKITLSDSKISIVIIDSNTDSLSNNSNNPLYETISKIRLANITKKAIFVDHIQSMFKNDTYTIYSKPES